MSDLISRQAAIKAINDLPNCDNGYSDTYDKACIIGMLEEVPTIDEQKIAVEYCQKRNLVMITAESFEVLKAHYNRINGIVKGE